MNAKTNSAKWSWIQANERRAAATGTLLLLLMLPTVGAQAGVVLTPLYSFGVLTNGAYPSGLVQDSDGNFYGTTPPTITARNERRDALNLRCSSPEK